METIEDIRTRVFVKKDHVTHTSSTDYPNNYFGFDDKFDWEKFNSKLEIIIGLDEELLIEFDIIGIDASIANAFRRICIAEVPTMAIEKVFISESNLIIYDEIMSQRLGLIPINADPKQFEWKVQDPTDMNTIVFEIDVECKPIPTAKPEEVDPVKKFDNYHLYSRSIKWVPEGDQDFKFENNPIKPAYDDILLAKMNGGHRFKATMHAIKGIGREHAKWSPVATCSYRTLPDIRITSPITGKDALLFQKCFLPGVIDIKVISGVDTAVVANSRKDSVSRECLRHDQFKDKVQLFRIRDHFIFSIESTGAYRAADIFIESCSILESKCDGLLLALDTLVGQ